MAADGGEPTFWALRNASDLVTALKDKEQRYFDAAMRRGLIDQWRSAYAQFYGLDPNALGDHATHSLARTGPEGKFTRFRVNEVRSFLKQQNVIALGERLALQCRAVNDDHSTLAEVEVADNVMQYIFRRAQSEAKGRAALEGDGCYGGAYGHLRWDFEGGDEVQVEVPVPGQFLQDGMTPATTMVKKMSGEPYVTVCYPWEVITDPSAREMNWAIVRERISKYELAAEWPEHAEKIEAMDILDEHSVELIFGFDPGEASTDDVIVKYFYYPKSRAIPNGRYCGIVGDIVLWDLPCPVSKRNKIPLSEMCSGKFVCSTFGYADGWDLIAIQEMIDQLCSDTASNLSTFGRNVMFYEKGTTSELSFQKLSEGLAAFAITPGAKPPELLNFAQMPDSVQWFIQYLHERMQSVSGLNSVARGNPDANIRSGEMAALFHSISIEFQSARQAAWNGYCEHMANLMLDFVRQYAQTPFLVEVAGENARPYLDYFTRDSFSGIQRVVIETTTPIMRSAAGRMQVLQVLSKLPPEDRDGAEEMLISGRTEQFTRNKRARKLRVGWENSQLAKGIQCQVLATDNPFEHVPDHVEALEKLASQDNPDAQLMGLYLQHINDHGTEYLGTNPLLAGFLQIPPPPALPGTPTADMQMAASSMGMPMVAPQQGAQAPQQQPANDNGDAQAQPEQKQRDPSGVKLPNPSNPPPEANMAQTTPQG